MVGAVTRLQQKTHFLRLQHKLFGCVRLDLFAAVEQREIFSLRPQWQQIGIVRAGGLAALAGSIDGQRVVPIAQVENLAIACADALPETSTAGGIDGVSLTWP